MRRLSALGRLASALILAVALGVLFTAPLTYAGRAICRTDPVLTLSNGATVTLYADISTTIDQVVKVQYSVRIPKGTTVTSISYPDGFGYLESVTWTADQAVSSYSAQTVVTTTTPGIPVSVFQSTTLASSTTKSQTVSGYSGQTIKTMLVVVK